MHTRRLATLLLGAWLAGTLFVAAVTRGNFQAVDRILQSPAPAAEEYIKVLGESSARTFLRYQVSERNRYCFHQWELVQLALGVALAITLLFGTNGNRLIMAVVLTMLLIVVVLHWLISPHLSSLGSAIDFLPAEAPSPDRVKFQRFSNAYSALEAIQFALGLGLSVRLLVVRSRRRNKLWKDIDAIDDADNGRING